MWPGGWRCGSAQAARLGVQAQRLESLDRPQEDGSFWELDEQVERLCLWVVNKWRIADR